MFNSNEQIEKQPCKPDPESLLRNALERRDNIAETLEHLRQIGYKPIYLKQNAEEGILIAIGQLTVDLWKAEDNIKRLTAELKKIKKCKKRDKNEMDKR